MVYLRTLGGLALVGDGIPSSANQRRRLALLVLLARSGDGGISRDRILALLWPEHSPEGARHALDQLLYATRRDLGRASVEAHGIQLRLGPAVVRADCAEFETLIGRGELERAVGLYTGPFLDGVHLGASLELERWVDRERALIEERYVDALEALATGAAARGDRREAVRWWRRRAAADPLNGRVARCLMEALAASGDRPGAIRHAEAHAALVRDELELEGDPEVAALVENLRAGGGAGTPDPATGSGTGPDRSPKGPEPDLLFSGGTRKPTRLGPGTIAAVLALLLGASLATLGLPDRQSRPWASGFGGTGDTLVTSRAPDPEAADLYLRGRVAWSRRSGEGLEEAVILFRRAAERDPGYVEAHGGLASAYVLLGYLGLLPGSSAFPKGKGAALQALALDPDLAEAHASLGMALQWEGRWEEAEEAFLRALERGPEYATAHQWYALLLRILDRREESVQRASRAAELDPLSIQIHNTLGMMLFSAGAVDSAFAVFQRVVTHEPDTAWVRENPWVLANFAKVAAAMGRHQEGAGLAERAAAAVPGHPRLLHALAFARRHAGDTAGARETFAAADSSHPHYAVYRAVFEAETGNLDSAFSYLEGVEEWSLPFLGVLSGDPSLAPLRADPRYPALRRRLGLPERGSCSDYGNPIPARNGGSRAPAERTPDGPGRRPPGTPPNSQARKAGATTPGSSPTRSRTAVHGCFTPTGWTAAPLWDEESALRAPTTRRPGPASRGPSGPRGAPCPAPASGPTTFRCVAAPPA